MSYILVKTVSISYLHCTRFFFLLQTIDMIITPDKIFTENWGTQTCSYWNSPYPGHNEPINTFLIQESINLELFKFA
jgi:hypothetical protein